MYKSIKSKKRDEDNLGDILSPTSYKEAKNKITNLNGESDNKAGTLGIRRNTVAVIRKEETTYNNPEKLGIYGYGSQNTNPGSPSGIKSEAEETVKNETYRNLKGATASGKKLRSAKKAVRRVETEKSPLLKEDDQPCSFVIVPETSVEDRRRDVTPEPKQKKVNLSRSQDQNHQNLQSIKTLIMKNIQEC